LFYSKKFVWMSILSITKLVKRNEKKKCSPDTFVKNSNK